MAAASSSSVIDGDPQPLRRQGQHAGQIVPGVVDRLALEIVAEAEVAQHLEEGVMAGGVADVLQVVVLAAGAHAALGADGAVIGAALAAEEGVLELDHAGVGEQQGCIVAGDQGAARHLLVSALGEVVEKAGAKLFAALHYRWLGWLCADLKGGAKWSGPVPGINPHGRRGGSGRSGPPGNRDTPGNARAGRVPWHLPARRVQSACRGRRR